jgi:hypothetical protein
LDMAMINVAADERHPSGAHKPGEPKDYPSWSPSAPESNKKFSDVQVHAP